MEVAKTDPFEFIQNYAEFYFVDGQDLVPSRFSQIVFLMELGDDNVGIGDFTLNGFKFCSNTFGKWLCFY